MIAAVQLRLPDLPDVLARAELQIEDAMLHIERGAEALARYSVDQPRAGVPPNPGWFAPKDGGGSEQLAQEDREERKESENPYSTEVLREAQWNARVAELRAIDPKNPALSYVTDGRSAPSQAALDQLDEALRQAATERVLDRVMPYGKPIGQEGKGADVREVRGGLEGAQKMFDYLSVGGTTNSRGPGVTVTTLPGNAGSAPHSVRRAIAVRLRLMSIFGIDQRSNFTTLRVAVDI